MSQSRIRRAAVSALSLAGLVVPTTFAAAQAIPAFPGADGAAGMISGGRATAAGGIVYHVTKLDSAIDDPQRNDPGTFRYGINNANFPAGVPRTIVFDVGGVIHLGRQPQPGWDTNGNGWDSQSRLGISTPNLTIAGQTAPGGAGIVFMGGTLKPQGTNQVYRNLTVAPGFGYGSWWRPGDPMPPNTDMPDSFVYDAFDISGQGIMIDHVSTLYGTDEHISANELANNVTVQYTSMSQGQNYPQADPGFTGHAFASLLQAGSDAKISFHHNLYAHQKGRLPRVGSVVGTGAHNDFRNNVFYNWLGTAGGGASGQPSFNKFVSNFYLAGAGGENPVGGTSTALANAAGGTGIFNGADAAATRIYHLGNVKDTNKDGDANDAVALTNGDYSNSTYVADSSFAVPYFGVTDTAAVAYDRVLNYMGARWWQRDSVADTIDERIVKEVRTGTGKIVAWADDPYNSDPSEGVEWRTLKNTPETHRPANWDVEPEQSAGWGVGDGMPTWWEVAHGLDPSARDDAGDFDSDGYTNLEEYLNEVAEWPAPKPIVFTGATNSRYEQITNWDIKWQPSKYDEAQINAGAATVNSVGQHARVLKVATNAGDVASLTVIGGWIDVEQVLQVGPAGSGRVTQSGGLVDVGGAVMLGGSTGASGAYNLQGGVLSTPLLAKGASGGTFNFTGGTLRADEVAFDLINQGGTLAPGRSGVGHTHVAGALTLQGGAVELEFSSDFAFDAITVDGALTLGGQLQVLLLDGYQPKPTDRFLVMSAASVAGSFASITSGFGVETSGGNVYLVAIPEPGGLGVAAAVFVLGARRRRRCTAPWRRAPSFSGRRS